MYMYILYYIGLQSEDSDCNDIGTAIFTQISEQLMAQGLRL